MKSKIVTIIVVILAFVMEGFFIFKNTQNRSTKNLSSQEINYISFDSIYNRATQYRLQDKVDSSINAYAEATGLEPDNEDALYYLGIMYRKGRDFEKARQTWEKLIKVNPQSERALIHLGDLYFCMTHRKFFNPLQAEFYFKKAIALNEDSLIPKLRLGEVTLFLNKAKDAQDIFNDLSAKDENNTEINFLNGFIYYKNGNETQAINYLKKAFLSAKADKEINFDENDERQCNMFLYYTTAYITGSGPSDIATSMPEIYKQFDQYLELMRDQLNHQ